MADKVNGVGQEQESNGVGPWLGPGSWPFVFDATSHREVLDGFSGREQQYAVGDRRGFCRRMGRMGLGERATVAIVATVVPAAARGVGWRGLVGWDRPVSRPLAGPVRPLTTTHRSTPPPPAAQSESSIDEQHRQKQRAACLERNRLCMHKPAQASRALIIHTNRRAYYEAHTTAVFCELLNTRVTALPTAANPIREGMPAKITVVLRVIAMTLRGDPTDVCLRGDYALEPTQR
ncbi:uncharacterized protein PAC_00656 [Phialocephala subalpina]|uniref:Uncharacterized protein n=1 Tax=Phialocephala subalpina TaxID=576137 RepID=A0A1L7WDB4_9HELO|nr:uncharacterized protein PAC_00656 [Phialocephala subalpina]